jgi:hypothetical protein
VENTLPENHSKLLGRDTSLQSMSTRDESWLARTDFAVALARDVLKQVLPPDSVLSEMYSKAATSETIEKGVSAYELAFFKKALESIDWRLTNNSPGTLPSTNNAYSDVERMLPQMVYGHPAFKTILALLVALAGTAAFGVFKFNDITVDIGKEIKVKQEKLAADFSAQKHEVELTIARYKENTATLTGQLTEVDSKLIDAKKQIAQLEVEAQGTLARFTSQVARNVEGDVAKVMNATLTVLDQQQKASVDKIDEYWEKTAKPRIKEAADKRVDQLLTDTGKSFTEKLLLFESRITESLKTQAALEARQKSLEGKQLLTDKAYSLLTSPTPKVVDRLSAYIGEAL